MPSGVAIQIHPARTASSTVSHLFMGPAFIPAATITNQRPTAHPYLAPSVRASTSKPPYATSPRSIKRCACSSQGHPSCRRGRPGREMLRPLAVDVPSGAVGRIRAVVPLQLERTVQQLRVQQGGELAQAMVGQEQSSVRLSAPRDKRLQAIESQDPSFHRVVQGCL